MAPAKTSGEEASPDWKGAGQRAACLISWGSFWGCPSPAPEPAASRGHRTAQQHWWGQGGSAPCCGAATLQWHECPGLDLPAQVEWRLFTSSAWQLLNRSHTCSRATELLFLRSQYLVYEQCCTPQFHHLREEGLEKYSIYPYPQVNKKMLNLTHMAGKRWYNPYGEFNGEIDFLRFLYCIWCMTCQLLNLLLQTWWNMVLFRF